MFRSLEFEYRRKQSCCMNDFSCMLQHLYHPVWDFNHDLQCPSQLSEVVHTVVRCITAWQIKRRGKQDHSWFRSLTRDRLIIALSLFYWPCPQFRPPGDYFVGLQKWVSVCLKGTKPSFGKVVTRKCPRDTISYYGHSPIVALFYWSCPQLYNTIRYNGSFAYPN